MSRIDMTAMTDDQLFFLAGLFADYVHDAMEAWEYAEVQRRNAEDEPYISTTTCASHDFTDANYEMARVFRNQFGVEPDPTNEEHVTAWNRIWAEAKRGWMTAGADKA